MIDDKIREGQGSGPITGSSELQTKELMFFIFLPFDTEE